MFIALFFYLDSMVIVYVMIVDRCSLGFFVFCIIFAGMN